MGTGRVMADWLRDFVDVIVPRTCCVCGRRLMRGEEIMCLHCVADLPRTGVHGDDADNDIAPRLVSRRVVIERVASWFYYFSRGEYSTIITEAKYAGRPRIGREAGRKFASEIKDSGFFDGVGLLVPVPIHPLKKIVRGYNQSQAIAEGVSAVTGIPVAGKCLAARRHGSQTSRGAYQRWLNSRDVYRVSDVSPLRDKHVVIVDDVLTTGSTLLACAEAIHEASPTTVISVMTLAATHKR